MGNEDEPRDNAGRWTNGASVGDGSSANISRGDWKSQKKFTSKRDGENTGTQFSKSQLYAAARSAGMKAYGKDSSGLIMGKPEDENVEHVSLSSLKGEEKGVLDTFEYVFFPSDPGKEALDVSDEEWRTADSSWLDKSGNIYTYTANEGMRVVHVDRPLYSKEDKAKDQDKAKFESKVSSKLYDWEKQRGPEIKKEYGLNDKNWLHPSSRDKISKYYAHMNQERDKMEKQIRKSLKK